MSDRLGLYVHVPFCRTRCRYCDFYKVGESLPKMELFLAALQREIEAVEVDVGTVVDSLFFGGGTPSLLEPASIAGLVTEMRRRYPVAADCEISLEANPSDLSLDRLRDYRAAGVNRLSLGVQSFRDSELGLLGRRHDGKRAVNCVRWAREAGFDNLSLDLMLGIPGQTGAGFRASLERALELETDHLSIYLLEVHAGGEMDFLRRERPGLFPSEEIQSRRYEWLVERLTAGGLEQYEISNFARPGKRCRHNLKYWRRESFLGFGPSAHSCLGDRRWRRPADLARYLSDPTASEPQESDPASERIFMGLRLGAGLAIAGLAADLEIPEEGLLSRLEGLAAFLVIDGDRVRFSVRGFLVSNLVLTEILSWKAEIA